MNCEAGFGQPDEKIAFAQPGLVRDETLSLEDFVTFILGECPSLPGMSGSAYISPFGRGGRLPKEIEILLKCEGKARVLAVHSTTN